MDSLSQEESTDVIRGVFNAYNFTGTLKNRETWVERLAELSQGWPQHINRVAVAAAQVIVDHGGQIEMDCLEKALTDGQKRKESYYLGRLESCSQEASLYKKIALATNNQPHGISRRDLRRLTKSELEESQTAFDDFLVNALHAGILKPAKELPDYYRIPIPSFGEYLRNLPI